MSFKNAFNVARKLGKGIFTWKGRLYNTMKKGENVNTFRQLHSDYDKFLGGVASNTGGWAVLNPIRTSYIVNKVPEPIKLESPANNTSESSTQKPLLQLFNNNDIRSLGFRNYSGLVSAVNNLANSNNNFIKALTTRYGTDTSKWNLLNIEKDLGVKGMYRSFGSGDFGDMSRSMANWLGTYNGNLAKQEQDRIWNLNAGVNYSLKDTSVLAGKYQLAKPLLNMPSYLSDNITNLKFKNGGMIYKYLQGGQTPQLNMLQQAIALVQAAMQGDLLANQTINLIMLAAKLGNLQALQVALLLQLVILLMLGSRIARLGAKLEYFKCGGKKSYQKLEHGDPIAEFKKKQALSRLKSIKKQDLATKDSIDVNKYNDLDIQINRPGSYKKGVWVPDRTKAPYNKVTKHWLGGSFKLAFDNAYGKQRYFTYNGKVYAAYKGDKATDKGFQGAVDNLQEQANALKDYNAGSHLGWNPGANKTANFRHNTSGTMMGVLPQVTVTAKRITHKKPTLINKNTSLNGWTTTAGLSRMSLLSSLQAYANNQKYLYGAQTPFENIVAQTGNGGNWHRDIKTWKDHKTGKSYLYVTRGGINYLSNGRYWNPTTKKGGNYTWKPGWRIFGGGFRYN